MSALGSRPSTYSPSLSFAWPEIHLMRNATSLRPGGRSGSARSTISRNAYPNRGTVRMNCGSDASSPMAARISLTKLARFFSTTKVAGHSRSWSSAFDTAFGLLATRMLSNSNALGDSDTLWLSRSNSRLSESSTNSPKRTCIAVSYLASADSVQPIDHEQVAEPSHVGIAVRLRVRSDHDRSSQVLNPHEVRGPERFPQRPVPGRHLHPKDINGCLRAITD